ncbi:xanthine dehydrogenase-like [Danaus plexippus]|uniref:xanthine dehydrogenase-like n=1 Tax=Danaus plexippus TaxID=13037 RepID=UPI002AB06110|nr:xanthine dehydrogenase-like [Danaus plexippus]
MDNIENHLPKERVTTLVFFVNGKKVIETEPDPEWTLLWYLRRKLQLTGTKYGCGEGGCGACTVMLSQYIKREDRVHHIAVNACLTPLCSIHGLAVTTVEGIGNAQDKLHPIQERIAKSHGSQCGFCTPGIVMSMYALLRNKNKIHYDDIEEALQGNLCRCTGYRPIVEGFKTFTEEWKVMSQKTCKMGNDCCRLKQNGQQSEEGDVLFHESKFKPYNPTQEPIFPPELKLVEEYNKQFLFFKGNNCVWIRPQNLQQLLKLKKEFPYSKIVVGNTEIGVEVKCKKMIYPILLSPQLITEMQGIQITDTSITVGATVSLTKLQDFLQNMISKNRKDNMKVFEAIVQMLYWFAGSQVRNVASIVGNIITASPISDLNPILMASVSSLNVCNSEGNMQKVVIDEAFFKSYRKVALGDDAVVISLDIPFTEEWQFFKAYKQSRRRDDDISIVTGVFNVIIDKASKIVKQAKLCYGGMGPTTVLAKKSSDIIIGSIWNKELLDKMFKSLNEEFKLDISVPGGMADYRKSLCLSLFFRFYNYVSNEIYCNSNTIKKENLCAAEELPRMMPRSSQCFEIIKSNKNRVDGLGKPIPHASAEKQATGEAMYCDDIPTVDGELFLSLVLSSESHAKIIAIDFSNALKLSDVVAFLSASDLSSERNKMGPIFQDEEIFSSSIVTSRSCVIGAVVAKTESAAKKAKDLIKVTYEKLDPLIITIEDAIRCQSFFDGYPRKLSKGDTNKAFAEAQHIREGYVRSGPQEHFYLETISAFAIREEEELKIICTSQNPADIAHIAAETLGIPNHKVVAKVKRIGGGFGGKETRAAVLAIPVAIAAYKLKKPVRAVLDRDEDMQVTGYRHPYLIKYKVAFDDRGKILGASYDLYANAGNYMDISCSMMERALFHVDNCYFIPNIQINGYLCKTNTPSNTAFRGFGAPQAMMAAETMIRDIASALNKEYEEIISANLYAEGSLTHFNQRLTYCTLPRCWSECIERSDYWQRKQDIAEYNRNQRWKKRGISIVPTKYGISFQGDLLMQGGVLLLIYKDGSVLLTLGGIEMGQGLFTKMIQVASRSLEVDVSKIHISEMATDKVPNSSPTAASISSDIYGMAVINACNTINDRLKPIKAKNPEGRWEEWISHAYCQRISLSAAGFYSAPKIDYDREKNSGNLYEYFTYGVACSEVIIDCLTGDHRVLRTDIVMDVGESLNPAIDIGQIEGAFIQGYGYYTLEEMLFSPTGEVLTKGPGAYKIPGFSDIPKEFNVALLKGAPNARAVYSSKAIGEPPLFLAASVFFAIKEAVKSARIDAGVNPEFILDIPASCARIRMSCEDVITEQVKPTITSERQPWNVTLS